MIAGVGVAGDFGTVSEGEGLYILKGRGDPSPLRMYATGGLLVRIRLPACMMHALLATGKCVQY